MKAKILEAEFHEEKLNLQHKHDLALQKVSLHSRFLYLNKKYLTSAIPDHV